MAVFRNTPAWIVLVSYLCANTFAAALHDHSDRCGHSAAGRCGADDHRHEDRHRQFCCSHCHGGEQSHERDDADDGGALHAPRSCVVCAYLAHTPLKAPTAALVPAGDLLPDAVQLPAERLMIAAPETHLARGPPAS
jgi:hypothetical protein